MSDPTHRRTCRGWPCREQRFVSLALLRLGVRRADAAAVFLVLAAHEGVKFLAVQRDREEALGQELRLDLRRLQRSREPGGELRERRLRRLHRREQAVPEVAV